MTTVLERLPVDVTFPPAKDFSGMVREGGITMHWRDGKLHREDGPAWEREGGTKYWMHDNKRHREFEPAVIRTDGAVEWWLDGEYFPDEFSYWKKLYTKYKGRPEGNEIITRCFESQRIGR